MTLADREVSPSGPPPRWASDRGHRLDVRVDPVIPDRSFAPCRIAIRPQDLLREVGIAGVLDPASIEVMAYEPASGDPLEFDPERTGASRFEVPSRYDGNDHSAELVWVMRNDAATHYSVYFDVRPDHSGIGVKAPGLIGDGDPFRLERGPVSHSFEGRLCIVDWAETGTWDLLTAGFSGHILYWKNIGTNADPLYDIPVPLRDADGKEIVVGQGQFLTHVGEEEGFHVEPTSVPGWNWISPTVADWTGTGRADDLLVGHVDGSIYHYRRTGSPSAATSHHTLEFVGKLEADGEPIVVGNHSAPFVVDWDGDGVPDLLVGDFLGRVFLFRNSGTAAEPRLRAAGPLQANGEELRVNITAIPFACDWNGDGRIDLLVGDHEGGVYFFENVAERGEPELTIGIPLDVDGREPLTGQYAYAAPVAIDWDGDGTLDLVVTGFETTYLFRGRPGGNGPRLEAPVILEARDVPLSSHAVQPLPEAVHWRGEREAWDLAMGTMYGQLIWFENNGTNLWPRFGDGEKVEAGGELLHVGGGSDGYGTGYPDPVFLDWDGDGDLDLVTATEVGWVYLFENVGTRSEPRYAAGVRLTTEGVPIDVTDRSSVLVVDWDGDGGRDLLVGHSRTYSRADLEIGIGEQYGKHGIVLFRGTGDPLDFAAGEVLQADGAPITYDDRLSMVAYTDWDGDGLRDLIVMEDETNVRFYRNVGSVSEPSFTYVGKLFPQRFSPQLSVYYGTMVDWNGDGREELLIGAGLKNGWIHYYVKDFFKAPPSAQLVGVEARS